MASPSEPVSTKGEMGTLSSWAHGRWWLSSQLGLLPWTNLSADCILRLPREPPPCATRDVHSRDHRACHARHGDCPLKGCTRAHNRETGVMRASEVTGTQVQGTQSLALSLLPGPCL